MGRPRSGLTDKQRLFASTLAAGGHSISDAYRAVYSAGNMSAATVRGEASRLAANPHVARMVEQVRAQNAQAEVASALSDRDRVLSRLREWIDEADTDSNRIRAAELLGKTVGLFRDVIQTGSGDRATTEIQAEIEQRLHDLLLTAEVANKDVDAGDKDVDVGDKAAHELKIVTGGS